MGGRTCDFCGGVAAALDGELGPLMGPLYRDKQQTRAVWFHRQCALYSPRVGAAAAAAPAGTVAAYSSVTTGTSIHGLHCSTAATFPDGVHARTTAHQLSAGALFPLPPAVLPVGRGVHRGCAGGGEARPGAVLLRV